MNTHRLLFALALAGAGLAAAHAATTSGAQVPVAPAGATTAANVAQANSHASAHRQHATHRIARTQHPAAASHMTAMERMHQRVARTREAEQQRWIDAEVGHGRLGGANAAALRKAAVELEREQTAMARRGGETVDDALAFSHREDVLDWAIRADRVAYVPQALRSLG